MRVLTPMTLWYLGLFRECTGLYGHLLVHPFLSARTATGSPIAVTVFTMTQPSKVPWGTVPAAERDLSTEETSMRSRESVANTNQRKSVQETIPHYRNIVSVYIFPVLYALALANNAISFVVIIKSDILKTSIGLYLAALAWGDCFAITMLMSRWWNYMMYGQEFIFLRMCNIFRFARSFCMVFSSLCVLCITTDRFIAVWFPLKAKLILSRKKSGLRSRVYLTVFNLSRTSSSDTRLQD